MIPSKKLSSSTAILPIIYLIIGNILWYVLVFNEKTADVILAIFFQPYLLIYPFEILTLAIALALTHVLIEKNNISSYKTFLRFSPYINTLIALLLVLNFSFFGSIIAITCALITAISLYLQRKQ